MSGMSMPPTKPILPLLEARAASTPTRNDPSCSLNRTDCTFGRSTTLSMMVKWMLGNSLATFSSSTACEKPTAMMGSWPRCARRRCACSNCVIAVEQAQRRFAQRGQDPIIAVGYDGILAALREASLRLLELRLVGRLEVDHGDLGLLR